MRKPNRSLNIMSKPFIDFAAVKAAVTIVQVLEHYDLMASMKPCGADGLRGPCPIHKGDDPKQFSVSISKNCWNCFSDCQGGGNILDFVAKMENVTIHEAAILITEWFRVDGATKPGRKPAPAQPREQAKPEAKPEAEPKTEPKTVEPDEESSASADQPSAPAPEPQKPEAEPKPEPAAQRKQEPAAARPQEAVENKPLGFELKSIEIDHPYFAERGLTPETVDHFGLGFCKKGTMAGRIVIPMRNRDGAIVGYAGRWPGEPPEGRPKYKLPKGFKKTAEVFNLHEVVDNGGLEPLIVVEGFFDCMKLWQAGFRRTVAIIGSSLSQRQEELILSVLTPGLPDNVALLFDEDEAGRAGRANVLGRLAHHAFVRVIALPAEGDQPDRLNQEQIEALLA